MNRIFALLALVVVVFSSCADELKPSFEGIPELRVGDTWNSKILNSGDVVADTVVRLWSTGVSTSNVEELGYKILLGTDTEDMVECNSLRDTITLKPYNQYFCQVVPYDKASGACGQGSEVYTFYCVPPVVAKTTNGNGEWSTTIDWGVAGDYMQPTTISVTPSIDGYAHENNVAIKKGQHSYKFKMGDASNPTNAAYTHWWDDAKAVYYEPIVYTYEFTVTVAVGDKTFEFPQEVKDIIINTKDVVKDHEFNVYRLAKIGNKIWTIDDYRATTYYKYWNGEYEKYETYIWINKKTSAAWYDAPSAFRYNEEQAEAAKSNHHPEYKNLSIPKGFHISTEQDWLDMEEYYGFHPDVQAYSDASCSNFQLFGKVGEGEIYGRFRSEFYVGNEQHIKAKLSSPYGWETLARNDSVEQSIGIGAIFNAKPNYIYTDGETEDGDYKYKFSFIGYYVPDGRDRFLTSESNGIAHLLKSRDHYMAIRLVKD